MASYNKHPNTRGRIIQEAARMFVEEGYSVSSINRLSKTLQLSPGNITFYFPTKEHLLAVLVDEMVDFQNIMMEEYENETEIHPETDRKAAEIFGYRFR